MYKSINYDNAIIYVNKSLLYIYEDTNVSCDNIYHCLFQIYYYYQVCQYKNVEDISNMLYNASIF